jgi:hypothetical protein
MNDGSWLTLRAEVQLVLCAGERLCRLFLEEKACRTTLFAFQQLYFGSNVRLYRHAYGLIAAPGGDISMLTPMKPKWKRLWLVIGLNSFEVASVIALD